MPTTTEKPINARILCHSKSGEKTVKPFLKWAGGKSQLLHEIEKYYPFADGNITKYAEPFVGGGAVLFDVLNKYNLEQAYISDINAELINTYHVICNDIDSLIENLYAMQNNFLPLDVIGRKSYYMQKRERFNALKGINDKNANIEKAALMIFLNKTCFNGLFRVNKKGLFNVPMGSYKNPLICDENNLRAVSQKLQQVTIMCGDYKESINFVDKNTFVYVDPPYRPITDTAYFTAYTENIFNDEEQMKLARFVNEMDKKGAKILMSNSDPKNFNIDDDFFDNIYSAYKIKRVEANRMINCNSKARGKIKELLISNFKKRNYMQNRDFKTWLSGFRDSIANYSYYINFEKVYRNVDSIKIELNNLVDYATGVETGLDSNGRKNRGGHLMEDLVERFIQKAGFIKNESYFKEMYIHQITKKWNIDLSAISNQGKMEKRFDFVIKTPTMIYGIETNFYGSSGSKLNETARSYKTLFLETETIDGFTFVWFTDGKGWISARNNLEETFDVMQHIYNIKDLEEGIIDVVFK